MVGNLYIRGAGGQNTNVGVTTFSGIVDVAGSNSTITLGNGTNRRLMYRSGDNDIILEGASNFFYQQKISLLIHVHQNVYGGVDEYFGSLHHLYIPPRCLTKI